MNEFNTHEWLVTLVILAVAVIHLQTRVALKNVCVIVMLNFMTIFQNMVIIRHKMDLFLFIVLKMLWMGLGS